MYVSTGILLALNLHCSFYETTYYLCVFVDIYVYLHMWDI